MRNFPLAPIPPLLAREGKGKPRARREMERVLSLVRSCRESLGFGSEAVPSRSNPGGTTPFWKDVGTKDPPSSFRLVLLSPSAPDGSHRRLSFHERRTRIENENERQEDRGDPSLSFLSTPWSPDRSGTSPIGFPSRVSIGGSPHPGFLTRDPSIPSQASGSKGGDRSGSKPGTNREGSFGSSS